MRHQDGLMSCAPGVLTVYLHAPLGHALARHNSCCGAIQRWEPASPTDSQQQLQRMKTAALNAATGAGAGARTSPGTRASLTARLPTPFQPSLFFSSVSCAHAHGFSRPVSTPSTAASCLPSGVLSTVSYK